VKLAYELDVLTLHNKQGSHPLKDFCANYSHPFYFYDLTSIEERAQLMSESVKDIPVHFHFAMKSNFQKPLLKKLIACGWGIDTVSQGEIELALECGATADQIVFSGVGKTATEIEFSLRSKVNTINVESFEEYERVHQIARKFGDATSIIGVRVNPDVDPMTHPSITTGLRDNKFGVDFESFLAWHHQSKDFPPSRLALSCHIGSQVRHIGVLKEAYFKMLGYVQILKKRGVDIVHLDLGGGLGIDYSRDPLAVAANFENYFLDETNKVGSSSSSKLNLWKSYASLLAEVFEKAKMPILLEPGRIVVGPFGALIAQVQYVKRTPYKNFVILDTGMNHLMRPMLYSANHKIVPIENPDRPKEIFDVVGPICESTDVLARSIPLPSLKQGEYVAILDTGAYGEVLANNYNLRPLAPAVFV